MKNVLITGGTGFVGRHLIGQLEADPNIRKIVVLLRRVEDWGDQSWTSGFTKVVLLKGGLNDLANLQENPQLDELDGVFHLAAMVAHNRRERDAVFEVNVEGTANIAKLAQAKGCRLVYVSTSGTIGCFDNPTQKADESADYVSAMVDRWPYYESKIVAEKNLLLMAKTGLDVVIVRPPIMLGPSDHRYRSTGILLKFLNRKLPMVIRGGYPMVDVRDAAAAMFRAMLLENPKLIYNLPGEEPSIDELFAMLEEISGVKAPSLHLPEKIVLSIAFLDEWIGLKLRGTPLGLVPDPVVIEMGTSYWGVTSLYAAADLGFDPRPARQTLVDTVTWLRENPPPETHKH